MKSDHEIASSANLIPIDEITKRLFIPPEYVIPYGRHIAKIHASYFQELQDKQDGSLILVTAMTPTSQGEGKTTVAIGLSQSLNLLGRKVIACIRQPSLGPYFGVKGGATGGGYSQVMPSDDISLHFTGDDHAVATAHNLISSIIDNHIYHGNKLKIDLSRILWKRVSNINDRALRKVKVGLTGKTPVERIEEFHISAASEIMSILSVSQNLEELKHRIENILLAFDEHGNPITPKDLNIHGAVTLVLRNAIHPNLVQSIEGVPVFIHGGAFGNVSLGCSSLLAAKLALKLSDYVITEAGFAADLGAEKFFNIKCRIGNLYPKAAVIVATLKAVHLHSLENLERHIENIKKFGMPVVVAINRFNDDRDNELTEVINSIRGKGVRAFVVDVRNKGGKGGIELAEELIEICKRKNSFRYLYPLDMPVKEKIKTIAKEIYGAEDVVFTKEAEEDIKRYSMYQNLPLCIAKTAKSLSDNPDLTGVPKGFKITVNRILPNLGAGFLAAICGNILLMPGLPEHPMAEGMDG